MFVFPVPIALALLLNSLLGERIKRVVQSILYLPHFLSWVIVVAIFQQMLGNAGLLNTWSRCRTTCRSSRHHRRPGRCSTRCSPPR